MQGRNKHYREREMQVFVKSLKVGNGQVPSPYCCQRRARNEGHVACN